VSIGFAAGVSVIGGIAGGLVPRRWIKVKAVNQSVGKSRIVQRVVVERVVVPRAVGDLKAGRLASLIKAKAK